MARLNAIAMDHVTKFDIQLKVHVVFSDKPYVNFYSEHLTFVVTKLSSVPFSNLESVCFPRTHQPINGACFHIYLRDSLSYET